MIKYAHRGILRAGANGGNAEAADNIPSADEGQSIPEITPNRLTDLLNSSRLLVSFGVLAFRFFVRRQDLFHVFYGILVEVLFAVFAAELHFVPLVFEDERFVHFP